MGCAIWAHISTPHPYRTPRCADMGDDMSEVCDMGPYQHTPPISHTSRCADIRDDMAEVCDMGGVC